MQITVLQIISIMLQIISNTRILTRFCLAPGFRAVNHSPPEPTLKIHSLNKLN